MLVKFNDLPDTARIWVYTSSRDFTDTEMKALTQKLEDFLKVWTAHGQGLMAGFVLPYKRFIVLGIDQSHAQASGCSIDASVKFIKTLEAEFQLSLLDNSLIAYKDNYTIKTVPFTEFKKQIAQGLITEDTIVFNHLVADKYTYLSKWISPAKDSWHQKFFPKVKS